MQGRDHQIFFGFKWGLSEVNSKHSNKGDSRYNFIEWVRPACNHDHILKDGDLTILVQLGYNIGILSY